MYVLVQVLQALSYTFPPLHFSSSDAFDLNFGVVIFRLRAGFDATEKKDDTGGTSCVCGSVFMYMYM